MEKDLNTSCVVCSKELSLNHVCMFVKVGDTIRRACIHCAATSSLVGKPQR